MLRPQATHPDIARASEFHAPTEGEAVDRGHNRDVNAQYCKHAVDARVHVSLACIRTVQYCTRHGVTSDAAMRDERGASAIPEVRAFLLRMELAILEVATCASH